MVIGPAIERLIFDLLGAANPAIPLIERLDPYRKVAVIMALLALIVIGVFLVAATMLGGNWARRLARQRPGACSKVLSKDHGVYVHHSRAKLEGVPPEIDTKNTVNIDRTTDETKVQP